MQSLGAALVRWQPAATFRADPVSMLKAIWPEIVGEELAAHCAPREISHNVLLITTRSSAWSQQLVFLSERLLKAIQEASGTPIERLRFRIGRIDTRRTENVFARHAVRRRRRRDRTPSETLDESLQRFQADVSDAQRTKASAGWKECVRCSVRIAPQSGLYCVACENVREQERAATVARLLFEAPWLGFAGIAGLVENLTPREYHAVRQRLLAYWWDVLMRLRRSGRAKASTHERLIASSFVLLKSGLDPERIAPAVVRNLLGDDLHDVLYLDESRGI